MSIRDEFTQGLRDLADWFDQHPEIPLPYGVESDAGGVAIGLQTFITRWDGDERREDVKGDYARAVSSLGGDRTKSASDLAMRVERMFGPGIRLAVEALRDDVCEAVVVGTETVEVQEVVTPAVTRTVTEQRDVVEWRCAPVLAETHPRDAQCPDCGLGRSYHGKSGSCADAEAADRAMDHAS